MRLTTLTNSCLLLLVLLFSAGAARAADTPQEQEIAQIQCTVPKGQLTQAIYNCIRDKMNNMSTTMITTVYNKLSDVVVSMLILAIVFFAIKFILYGTRQMQAEFMIMMLKLISVAGLIIGIRTGGGILELRDTILNAPSAFQSLVLTGSGTFGVTGQNIYEQMDNMLFKIYGIKDPQNVQMDSDMAGIGMMGGLMLAGPIGAKAFVQGNSAVALLIGSFMIALYINVVAMIALTFLFALSPIFLPLMLFPATERMFQKWRGQIVSYALQPMVMTVFISMMFLMLADRVGSLDNFIQTARKMSNDPGVSGVRRAMSTATAIKDATKGDVGNNQGDTQVDVQDATITGNMGAGIGNGVSVNMRTFGNATNGFSVPVVPFDANTLTSLASQMVILLIICGAMFRFMRELPGWATELAGGDRTVPNLTKLQPIQQIDKQFTSKK